MGARGIHLTDEQQTLVASCSDIDQLDLWLNRAVGATSVSDIFKD